jgi:hypothetical protein
MMFGHQASLHDLFRATLLSTSPWGDLLFREHEVLRVWTNGAYMKWAAAPADAPSVVE